MREYLVRIGVAGHVHRSTAVEIQPLKRRDAVICRTERGLEFGSVLNQFQGGNSGLTATARILRLATPEDHLLWARIEKNRHSAMAECQRLLDEQQSSAVLMDVELLFDGRTILFHFLGEVSPEVERLTSGLAEAYEAEVQLGKFAETLIAGCGPDCGTGESDCGSGSGGCSTCSVASSCGVGSSKVRSTE